MVQLTSSLSGQFLQRDSLAAMVTDCLSIIPPFFLYLSRTDSIAPPMACVSSLP